MTEGVGVLSSTPHVITAGFLRGQEVGKSWASFLFHNKCDSDWVWLLVYDFFWVPFLAWIMPYAALTPHRTGWLTRGMRKPLCPTPYRSVLNPSIN